MDATRSAQSIHGQDEQKLYDELKSAVWVIHVESDESSGTGTGFCIDQRGLIMTCAHCVSGKTCFVARQNDKKFQKAYVLHKIESWDIAILCFVPNGSDAYPAVSLANDGTLVPGQDVYAISNQHSLMYSFCSGKVSYPCSDTVRTFDRTPRSFGKEPTDHIPSETSEYRTQKETSFTLPFNEDLPIIEMRNIHLGHGGSGGPIFLHIGKVVWMMSSGDFSKSYAVHVSALRIAFEEAKKLYSKLVNHLAASEKQSRDKNEGKNESNKSNEK